MWIVVAYGRDFNVRRVERFLALAGAARVDPTVVVNKCDLGDPPLGELRATGAPVLPISALTGAGLDALHLAPGESTVLLGSSGAGKSTLVNRLAGSERLATGPVRDYDERGRHTTTHRELVVLPGGGIVIDTPGMKVVGLAASGSAAAFPDIEALARACRFNDCAHEGEPGCAVAGEVDAARLDAYRALRVQSARERRRRAKAASRAQRRYYRERARP
jgi:ribosome biogenesis GTPase